MRLSADVSVIGADNFNQRSRPGNGHCFQARIFGELSVPASPQLAGLRERTGHHGPEHGSVAARPLSTQWLSDERIAEARRVWSKAYGRVISEEEAIEILMNVRRLAEVLLRAKEEKEK